jgi:hypothetical protein
MLQRNSLHKKAGNFCFASREEPACEQGILERKIKREAPKDLAAPLRFESQPSSSANSTYYPDCLAYQASSLADMFLVAAAPPHTYHAAIRML